MEYEDFEKEFKRLNNENSCVFVGHAGGFYIADEFHLGDMSVFLYLSKVFIGKIKLDAITKVD